LDELYTSFDSKEYENDLKELDQLIAKFNKWANNTLTTSENPVEKIEKYINFNQGLSSLFSKLASFANLSASVDARNEIALQSLNKLDVKATAMTKPEVQFQNFIKEIDDLDSIIDESDLLKEHEFYLLNIKEKTKYLLSEKEEILISKMSTTGSTAWSNLQDKVSSTLMVDISLDGEDKQLPLPVVRNFAYSSDSGIRKTDYEAELDS